jgi:hypothetical protein
MQALQTEGRNREHALFGVDARDASEWPVDLDFREPVNKYACRR